MVRLNDKQEQHLARIRAQKQHYDVQLAALELDFARQKDALKDPIRKLVVEAQELDIPVRQIHIKGMDFAYISSLTNFLAPHASRGIDTVATLTQTTPVPAVSAMLRDDGYSIITLDKEGNEVKLDYSNTPPYRESRWFQFDVDTLDRDTLRAISTYKGKGWYISEEDCPDWLRDELPEDYWD